MNNGQFNRLSKSRWVHQQRGVALITALLVVAIATIAVVSLASRQNMDIRRTGNVIDSDQAYLYALGVETVARELLSEIRVSKKESYDTVELTTTPLTYPVEGGIVSGSLVDLDARFNLNTLIDGNGRVDDVKKKRFSRLLRTVLTQLDERALDPDEMTNAVVDWIDSNEESTSPGGAEDSAYSSEKQPYRVANRRMSSPTELLLVRGFTKDILYGKKIEKEKVPGLLNYVAAVPSWATAINVNKAEPPVLLSLSEQLTESMVKDLIKDRPYHTTTKFSESPVLNGVVGDKEKAELKKDLSKGITVQSSYFQINARAQVARAEVAMTSLIYTSTEGGSTFTTISRSIGTDGL